MPNRRSVLLAGGAGFAVWPLEGGALTPRQTSDWEVGNLLVDGLVQPMGLHGTSPRLSWQLISDRYGARQTAWRIGVASSRSAADKGRFDLWDSGRVDGDSCFDVAYAGVPLTSRRRAWWRVTAWDERGTAATSSVAFWEMGLLATTDWSAQWLSAETVAQRQDRETGLGWRTGPIGKRDGTQAFRLLFTVPQAAELTVLTACSAGSRVWLDGEEIIPPKRGGWGSPGPRSAIVAAAAGTHSW